MRILKFNDKSINFEQNILIHKRLIRPFGFSHKTVRCKIDDINQFSWPIAEEDTEELVRTIFFIDNDNLCELMCEIKNQLYEITNPIFSNRLSILNDKNNEWVVIKISLPIDINRSINDKNKSYWKITMDGKINLGNVTYDSSNEDYLFKKGVNKWK